MKISKEVFELIFPKDTFEWFEITDSNSDENNVYITLTEKDLPPLNNETENKKIIAKKFHNITITDFPLRGKRVNLTFRRRYWKLEGQKEYLKRDIELCAPGTQLETEFAAFLKGASREVRGILDEYC